jgi:uncharacterized membrane protein
MEIVMLSIEHIHPMIVHFPIALLSTAILLNVINVVRGGDMAGRQFLAQAVLGLLALGTLGAGLAVVFGDLALETAVTNGFPEGMAEGHEGWAFSTLIAFAVLTGAILAARWRSFRLVGGRALALTFASVVCFGILATTAFLGGELVYAHGVNVHATAQPTAS